MSALEDVHARIRDYLAVLPGVATAEYPAPNSITNNTIVIYAGDFDITHGTEMYLMGTSRAVLYIAPTDTAMALGKADGLALAVVDQFAATNPLGFHLDGLVDFCQVSRVELSRVVSYAGHEYFGAIFYFRLKIRRFAGIGIAA